MARNIGEFMRRRVLQSQVQVSAASCCFRCCPPARHRAAPWPRAATTTPTTSRASRPPPADAAKDNQRKTDEFAEAAQAINGPAGNPECVWLGRRVVRLMWRDDLDTAFRHLDLYDRFGCPGGHIQATFRCLTRFGAPDRRQGAESLDRPRPRLLDQSGRPAAAAAAAAAPAAPTADLGLGRASAGRFAVARAAAAPSPAAK